MIELGDRVRPFTPAFISVPLPCLAGRSPFVMSAAASNDASASSLLSFYRLVSRLKTTKRTGWVRASIPQPESVADHMYRMSLIALTLPPSLLPSAASRTHAAKLALAHDLAEALVGDITPHDNVPKAEKHRLEHDAMLRIRSDLECASPAAADELFALWSEYEAGESECARIVRQIDKLEMVLQADEYERMHGTDLSDFFRSTESAVTAPALRDVDVALRAERAARRTPDEA